jgi:hypothetical protein
MAFTGLTYGDELLTFSTAFSANIKIHKLEKVPSLEFERFPGLNSVDFCNFEKLEDLSLIDSFDQLERISISGCGKFRSLDGIQKHHDLKTLLVFGFRSKLKDVSALKNLQKLELINIDFDRDSTTQKTWDALAGKPNLHTLRIGRTALLNRPPTNKQRRSDLMALMALEDRVGTNRRGKVEKIPKEILPGKGKFRPSPRLEVLIFGNIEPGLEDLQCFREMPQLRVLKIKGSPSLTSLNGLENCKELVELRIDECPNLKNVDALKNLGKLESLFVGSSNLEKPFPKLTSKQLVNVVLKGVDGYENLEFLQEAKLLTRLDVSDSSLQTLKGLQRLVSLRELKLQGSEISRIGCERVQAQIVDLDFTDCDSLVSLDDLNNIVNLESICLKGCMSLESLEGMQVFESMTQLDVSDCRSLKTLDGISALKNLQQVLANGCLNLENVDELLQAKQLSSLHWTECPKLKEADIAKLRKRFPFFNDFRENYDAELIP